MDESEFNLSHFTFYAGLENILSLQRLHLHVRQKTVGFLQFGPNSNSSFGAQKHRILGDTFL
jgi:hypothetical protein